MPRPTVTLTDDQARQLVAGLVEVEHRNPLNSTNHKAFLREFISLVHRITDRTFSPMVYRRLLGAFAPDRRPSTTTIAVEKDRFVDELKRQEQVLRQAATNVRPAPSPLPALDFQFLQQSIAQLIARGAGDQNSYLQQQCAFLQNRLSSVEKDLMDVKVEASRLLAERNAAQERAELERAENERLRTSSEALSQEIARLATVLDDARKFTLLAIDDARAETRAWKDRCQHAESQVKEQVAAVEIFRRLAYRQGAEIPPLFNKSDQT